MQGGHGGQKGALGSLGEPLRGEMVQEVYPLQTASGDLLRPAPPATQPYPGGWRARGGRGSATEQESDGQPQLPGRLSALFQSTPWILPDLITVGAVPRSDPLSEAACSISEKLRDFPILGKRVAAEGRRAA